MINIPPPNFPRCCASYVVTRQFLGALILVICVSVLFHISMGGLYEEQSSTTTNPTYDTNSSDSDSDSHNSASDDPSEPLPLHVPSYDGLYPYPPGGPTGPVVAHWSTSYCTNVPTNYDIKVPLVTENETFLQYIVPSFIQMPPIPDIEPITLFVDANFMWVPPQVLIEPGSNCRKKGNPYDCDVQCPVKCRVTSVPEHKAEAHGVMQLMSYNVDKANDRQYKLLFYPEPHLGDISNMDFTKQFDIIMHWHRTAHIKLMSHDNKYFTKDELQYDQPDFPEHSMDILRCERSKDEELVKGSLISWAQSNCGGERVTFFNELVNYLHITSYGSCMNNRPQPQGHPGYETKRNVQSQHKFCLTLENYLEQEDWVTEKIYHSLASGCIPVYKGAINIEEYVPCDNCVILANSFSTVKELADYLIYLDKNTAEYNKYLEYKQKPLVLKPMLQASKRFSFCNACYLLSLMKQGKYKPEKIVWSLNQRKWINVDEA